MYTRKSALTQAKKYRTCPPPHISDHPLHQQYVAQHLEICPYCSKQVMEENSAWGNLLMKVRENLPYQRLPSPKADEISPGQCRYIKSELGRWHNKFFYNPPLVIILETTHSDNILVAQTYHDMVLAGPGDLILPGKNMGMNEDIFAECWNTYMVSAENMGPSVGKTDSEIVAAIRQLIRTPDAYPSWALLPRPLTENDSRIYFRAIEQEVSRMFSLDGLLEK